MSKQRVLLLGATGETGGSILHGLLKDPESFEVEALVRPSSVGKPRVKKLEELGVKTRVLDIGGPVEELTAALTGVDVLISAIDAMGQLAQLRLVTAAKEAGVKRSVSCAFTTVASPGGVMRLRERFKEQVYQELRKHFLPYTIIDVGYWHQISFPTVPSGRLDYASLMKMVIHAGGTAPTMLTDLRDIGPFVARIIKDPRTLNKAVFTHSDVLSENEIFDLVEQWTGDDIVAAKGKATEALKADPTDHMAQMMSYRADYDYSTYVRGENTPAYSEYLGYLDGRKFYPDFRPTRFKEFMGQVLEGKAEMPYAQVPLLFVFIFLSLSLSTWPVNFNLEPTQLHPPPSTCLEEVVP
ncbi:hypothetical protein DFH06DRAFT_1428616 [Mycena polygramma]|nr:hypothetical protein DFH06DRAFT_1428616 [Mycena polygramma]